MSRRSNSSKGFLFLLVLGFVVLAAATPPATGASPWNPQTLIQNYLKQRYPWAEIEVLELSGLETTPREVPEKIHMLEGPLGKAVFSLVFSSGRKVRLEARVRALDWAVTARRPLKRGQVIEKDDLYVTLVDIRHLPKGSLGRMEAAWGKTLTRSIGANVPLVETDLSEPPLVKKGQKVLLVASAPGLRITTLGETREDGYAGRQIRVLNLDSKKNIRGTLVDEQQVRVDF